MTARITFFTDPQIHIYGSTYTFPYRSISMTARTPFLTDPYLWQHVHLSLQIHIYGSTYTFPYRSISMAARTPFLTDPYLWQHVQPFLTDPYLWQHVHLSLQIHIYGSTYTFPYRSISMAVQWLTNNSNNNCTNKTKEPAYIILLVNI